MSKADRMQAMVLREKAAGRVETAELPVPVPGPGQIRVKVAACGVCRTDLHVVDGELPDPRLPVVPGHEIVGTVDALGEGFGTFTPGQRVGVPWLGFSCGVCGYCTSGRENICGAAPPEPLDAAILFAPVGALVPEALRRIARGGTVVCAGIHMSDIPSFPYRILREERTVRSVANLTRRDAEQFLALAPKVPVRTHTTDYPLAEANRALDDLRSGRIRGAAVLRPRDAGGRQG